MEDLYTPIYKDEGPFFLSNFSQITRCVRIHGVHNEEAIDRNTEAIIEQTEMQKSESDESQVQFSGHSMMLERESNESQQLFERELDETQEVLSAHTKAMQEEAAATRETLTEQGIAIKNAIDDHAATVENALTAQTSVIEGQGTGIKNAITAQTSSMKAESDETQTLLTNKLQDIIDKLSGIKDKIKDDEIRQAIEDLELVNNNYNTNNNYNYNN